MNMSKMVVMRLSRIEEGQLEGKAPARWRSHEVGSSAGRFGSKIIGSVLDLADL